MSTGIINVQGNFAGASTGRVLVGLVNGPGEDNATAVLSEVGLLPSSSSIAFSKPHSRFFFIIYERCFGCEELATCSS